MDTGAFYMTIPIILDGERCGAVVTRREGAYTVFEARCALRPGLVRLYLFGPDGRGYLGLLCPEGGELRLRRRLSRAEMRRLPAKPEYASAEPQSAGSAPEEAPQSAGSVPEEATRRTSSGPEGAWLERGDGSLVLERGGERLLALPCALRSNTAGVRLIERGGRRYMVFRY